MTKAILAIGVMLWLPCCTGNLSSDDGRSGGADAQDPGDATAAGDGTRRDSATDGPLSDALAGDLAASSDSTSNDGQSSDATLAGGLVHGQLATVSSAQTGASLGTRPNYNYQAQTWQGKAHLHWRFTDLGALATGPLSDGAAVDGFSLQNNKNPGSDGHTIQAGGPSQSGKYLRSVPPEGGASTAALAVTTPKSAQVPAMHGAELYVCFKMRTSPGATGKVFRWWHNGDQYNWYQTPTAVMREPYPSAAVWCPNQDSANPGAGQLAARRVVSLRDDRLVHTDLVSRNGQRARLVHPGRAGPGEAGPGQLDLR